MPHGDPQRRGRQRQRQDKESASKRRLYTGKCRQTNKRKFENEIDVLIEHMNNPLTIRAYRCPFCNGFHATSQV